MTTFKVGDTIKTKGGAVGVVTDIEDGVVTPVTVEFGGNKRRYYSLDGRLYPTPPHKDLIMPREEKETKMTKETVKIEVPADAKITIDGVEWTPPKPQGLPVPAEDNKGWIINTVGMENLTQDELREIIIEAWKEGYENGRGDGPNHPDDAGEYADAVVSSTAN